MHIIGIRSFWIPLIIVTGLSAAVCVALSGRRDGIQELRKREARLQARLQRLQDKNQDLRARRNALLSSLNQIERVAREEYGYRGPDEFVRTIPTEAPEEPARSSLNPTDMDREDRPWWMQLTGAGRYPWRIPVLVAGISFFVIPLLNALGASKPAQQDDEE